MLGHQVFDPEGIESSGRTDGLGLLPIQTTMRQDKTTVGAQGQLAMMRMFGMPIGTMQVCGYEIHVGETIYLSGAQPFAEITRKGRAGEAKADGCISADGLVWGTYLHGIFDEDNFRHGFLAAARAFFKMERASALERWSSRRERDFDRLARTVAKAVDLRAICGMVGLECAAASNR
jgi:adenosylcobyric acid synthase